jgi:putative acetyltransferase
MSIVIRPEAESDRRAIWEVTRSAFEGRPYAAGDEQDLIDNLRADGVLSVSLVAIDGSELIGQITFSPASISSNRGNWYALGPVSVIPERQGEGTGAALIDAGIKAIESLGAVGCILTGDPGYYSKHGFTLASEHCPELESEEYFMVRVIGDEEPVGTFAFHVAFYEGT